MRSKIEMKEQFALAEGFKRKEKPWKVKGKETPN